MRECNAWVPITVLCCRERAEVVRALHVAHREYISRLFFLSHRRRVPVRFSWLLPSVLLSNRMSCLLFGHARYKNKRGWHALFHSDCQNGSTAHGAAGGHGYSADGKTWKFHPMNAYSNVVKLKDGTEWTLNRRER